MEIVTLTNPVPTYRVVTLSLYWDDQVIHVRVRTTVEPTTDIDHRYTGTEAETLMRALNKADLSTKSLHRRILEKMVADGVLTGTISGAPD